MRKSIAAICAALLAIACSKSDDQSPVGLAGLCQGNAIDTPSSNTPIRLNQLGFQPSNQKIAIVEAPSNTHFYVASAGDNQVVFCSEFSAPRLWEASGETVSQADFSAITKPGRYYIGEVAGRRSPPFEISDTVFLPAERAALKAFYFNRASTALPRQYAGQWQRDLGHPDQQVFVHPSAASEAQPEGSVISAPKGWYDAGDYNKYIVNSGISVYTLLAAYEHYKSHLSGVSVDIPESTDNVPDILNEVMWNLEWMATMQRPDGGVYHKLTTQNFVGQVMPSDAGGKRFVVQATTAATLDFAAVMAVAARVYQDYEAAFPGKSAAFKQAALAAWQWAEQNPDVIYQQPDDIKTGTYGDENLTDEFAWAAAELFLLTKDTLFWQRFQDLDAEANVPWWGGVATLGFLSLAQHAAPLLPEKELARIKEKIFAFADASVARSQVSAYGVDMNVRSDHSQGHSDFVWGSNSVAANRAFVLLSAYRLSPNEQYLHAATGLLDYLLGRNATGYSFVTGIGHQSPMYLHHRASDADDIDAPIPGLLVGGPFPGQPESPKCDYPSTLAAKSYSDSWCSYATNEVAINWNAPLVYILAALNAQSKLGNSGR